MRIGYEEKIERWLNGTTSLRYRISSTILGIWHNKRGITLRPIGIAHWIAKTGLASSAPGLAYFYGSIGLLPFATATIAIFAGHSTVSILDEMSKKRARGLDEAQSLTFIRYGDLLESVMRAPEDGALRDDAIRACLGIIENFARQLTQSDKGEIAVTLALYVNGDRTKMRIRHRNPGNTRPQDRTFDCRNLFGHRACNDGKARVVHDIRYFGPEACVSPTSSSTNYRSIMVIPIDKSDEPSKREIRGFVSIDSARPYAFYRNRARTISVDCSQIIRIIAQLA